MGAMLFLEILEMEVLMSMEVLMWAIERGKSLDPIQKHLK